MSNREKKNEIIIAEIQYWKKTKLLPETYCNFLLALYTKGDGSAHESDQLNGTSIKQWLQLLLLILIVPIFLVLYINFNSLLQMAMLLILIIIGFILHTSLSKTDNIIKHLSLIVFLFIVLLMTISLSKFMLGNQYVTNGVILINFISWFLLSLKKKYTYLIVLSSLAILFMGIYIVL